MTLLQRNINLVVSGQAGPRGDDVVFVKYRIACLAIAGVLLAAPAQAGICVGTFDECIGPMTEKGQSFDLLIKFDLDSAELSDAAKDRLRHFADALKDDRFASTRFVVEGHTDATGPEAYNLDLSIHRAEAVVGFLVSQGVPPDRLEAVGLGELSPRTADPLDSENRRVETRIRARQ